MIVLRFGQRLEDVPDPQADLFEAASSQIASLDLHRRLRSIPRQEREVLRWRYGLGSPAKTHREIGGLLGVSAATVVNIEQRGLELLRKSFDQAEAA